MNKLNQKLTKIIQYWAHNLIFESNELENLDYNLFNKASLSLLEEIIFYVEEGLTKENSKDNQTLSQLYQAIQNKKRNEEDNKLICRLAVEYTSQVLDKENKIPLTIKNRYEQLVKINYNQRTEEENIEVSNLANQILKIRS